MSRNGSARPWTEAMRVSGKKRSAECPARFPTRIPKRRGAQHTVYKAMEQIDRHGTLPESGIAVGFPGDYGAYEETAKDTP